MADTIAANPIQMAAQPTWRARYNPHSAAMAKNDQHPSFDLARGQQPRLGDAQRPKLAGSVGTAFKVEDIVGQVAADLQAHRHDQGRQRRERLENPILKRQRTASDNSSRRSGQSLGADRHPPDSIDAWFGCLCGHKLEVYQKCARSRKSSDFRAKSGEFLAAYPFQRGTNDTFNW